MQNYGLQSYLPYSNSSLGQPTQGLPGMDFMPINSTSPKALPLDSFQNSFSSDTSPSMETQLFSMMSMMISAMEMLMTSVINSGNFSQPHSNDTDILSEADDSSDSSSASKGTITLFGGSQCGENNIAFANDTDKPMMIYAQKGLKPGEKDPGGTVFSIPAHSKMIVNAPDDNGLRFQKFTEKLSTDQKAQLQKDGMVKGITAPAKTGTLYETNYVADKHLSYDDISPLDGANIPMTMSGHGGRTVKFTQDIIDGAPTHNDDGTIPGLGPDASSTGNAATDPALRDYYKKTSLKADGTRDFYYNSSVGGDADKANVSYKGAGVGKVRTTVNLG